MESAASDLDIKGVHMKVTRTARAAVRDSIDERLETAASALTFSTRVSKYIYMD